MGVGLLDISVFSKDGVELGGYQYAGLGQDIHAALHFYHNVAIFDQREEIVL